MASFKKVIDIHASPARVFEVLHDVEHWPEWTPTTLTVRRLGVGPFTVGGRALVHQPKLLPAVWEVTVLEENRSFSWATCRLGLQMVAHHRIEEHGAASRVELVFELHGILSPVVAWTLSGLIGRYLAMEAAGLQSRCEGDFRFGGFQ